MTEPEYLNGFKVACRNSLVDIEIPPEHGVPLTLVRIAKRLRNKAISNAHNDENLQYDEVWCVFDTDDHPHIAEATIMASQNGIKLAVSNPSFELWLLLHFRESPGMQHRDRVKSLLKNYLSGYDDDGKHVDFDQLRAGYCDAVSRAERLDRHAQQDNEAGRNPTTGVYQLTELIRGDWSFSG